jgi:glycosyltransferase involved in cell wall biosynthesis
MDRRVCLFTDSLSPSGVGQHMLALTSELTADHEVLFVCPPTDSGGRVLERARELGAATAGLTVRGDREAARRLGALVREHGVDVFHCHAGVTWEGHEGIRAARAADVPAVVRTEHLAELTAIFRTEELPDLIYSPYHLPDRRPSREELERMVTADRAAYLDAVADVDRLICVSEGVRDSYLEVGVDPRKIRVVRNGIRPAPARSRPRRTRAGLGVAEHRRMVLTVGRMIDVKGHLFLLGAVEKVVRRYPQALFVWAGTGPMEDELRERVRRDGLEHHVMLAGQRSDVPDLIAASDLLVLPSLVEGLPLVVLEAMAAGRPVVGTRVCGTREVIRDGITGRLVEPGTLDGGGDTEALAAAILQPLENPALQEAWGRVGRALFEEAFTCERMARDTAAVYAELVPRRAPLLTR